MTGRYRTLFSEQLKIVRFIENAKSEGLSDSAIVSMLEDAGWPSLEIDKAFVSVNQRAIRSQVPQPTVQRDGIAERFLYLSAFALLWIWIQALTQWSFITIDQIIFEDERYEDSDTYRAIAFSIARLLVATPLYVWVLFKIDEDARYYNRRPFERLRRVLSYAVLLILIVIFVVSAVVCLFFLLEGELSRQFLIKLVVLFLVTTEPYRFASRLR